MAAVPPQRADAFGADLLAGYEAARQSVVPATRTGKDNTFAVWEIFCTEHGQDCLLDSYDGDKLDFLVVFALRYSRGEIGKTQRGEPTTDAKPVRAKTVQNAVQAIGEEFALVDRPDPRLDANGNIAPRLKKLFKFLEGDDPAPSRVWPVCTTILLELDRQLQAQPDQAKADAIRDLCVIAFFFLCRPGEYAVSSNADRGRSKPFRLKDVAFSTPTRRNILAHECPLHDVYSASYAALTYTDQKNAVRGESIGHHTNGDHVLDPVRALQRRVDHLRTHRALPKTPLHTYYTAQGPRDVKTIDITHWLRRAAAAVYNTTGIPSAKVQAYSLRSGGATALLCAYDGNTDIIQIIGRWKSDSMLRYLRTQAIPLLSNHAAAMLHHGSYTFAPTNPDPDLLPRETPTRIRAELVPLREPTVQPTAVSRQPSL